MDSICIRRKEECSIHLPSSRYNESFIFNISGRKSHAIIEKGMQVLLNLEHRGATGSEKNTGDGADEDK